MAENQQAASVTSAEIVEAVNEAHALTHPWRSMRVTLECAHLRLVPAVSTVMGIGAKTGCNVCPPTEEGYPTARLVVNIEETGHLDDTWIKWRTEQKQRGARR